MELLQSSPGATPLLGYAAYGCGCPPGMCQGIASWWFGWVYTLYKTAEYSTAESLLGPAGRAAAAHVSTCSGIGTFTFILPPYLPEGMSLLCY